jgi:Zn-dependent protease/CBS domain-containing protein
VLTDAISIGRLAGIRVSVSPSWLIILALITIGFGALVLPAAQPRWPALLCWAVGFGIGLLFSACVLLHELAHSAVARSRGVPVRSITLFLFGGLSRLGREAPSPSAELAIAAAGPLASLAIAAIALGAALWIERPSDLPLGLLRWLLFVDHPRNLVAMLLVGLAGFNALLYWVNLVPGFPLDGGRVLRSLVWYASDDYHWASLVAIRCGQLAAIGLLMAGVVLALERTRIGVANGVWLALMGLFLLVSASQSYRVAELLHLLDGGFARDLLKPARTIAPTAPLDEAAALLNDEPQAGPLVVVDEGRPLGLISPTTLARRGAEGLGSSPARLAMRPLPEDAMLSPDQPASHVLRQMLELDFEQLPVVEDGELTGLVLRDDVVRAMELRRRLGQGGR